MDQVNRLLIVEDDTETRELIALVADKLGYRVATAEPATEFHAVYRAIRPTVIVLDLMMPGIDGIQILRVLAAEKSDATVILLSSAEPRVLDVTARIASGHGLKVAKSIRKPATPDYLAAVLGKLLVWPPALTAAQLEHAIEQGEIEVAYQPIVALNATAGWTVTGVEALARWRHPQLGVIGPDHFIAQSEQWGLIGGLTEVVFRQALRQAALMHELGYAVGVSINLSPYLLDDAGVPQLIANELACNGLRPERLTLEITESAAVDARQVTRENITRLRLTGAQLSMDDFGSGYASLVQLYRMPFGEMKLDRSLIQETLQCKDAWVFVRSFVALAHDLGVRVCAEGVETPDTLEHLRAVGCDQMQGFFISKPLWSSELAGFFAKNLYGRSAGIAKSRIATGA